jgi:uncharacterized protein (TIGR02596 family)
MTPLRSSPNHPRPHRRVRAFTLVEMLVVLAIIVALSTLAIRAFGQLVMGTQLSRSGQLIVDLMTRARQEAVTSNQEVQMHFYGLEESDGIRWQAIQIKKLRETQEGPVSASITPITRLPESVIISADSGLSPLLHLDPGSKETVTLEAFKSGTNPTGKAQVTQFSFLPSGAPETSIVMTNNFVTLHHRTAKGSPGSPPANFYTAQVNPVTGKVTVYRP